MRKPNTAQPRAKKNVMRPVGAFPQYVYIAKTPAFGPDHTTSDFTLGNLVTREPKQIATYKFARMSVMSRSNSKTQQQLDELDELAELADLGWPFTTAALAKMHKKIMRLRRAVKRKAGKKTVREKC